MSISFVLTDLDCAILVLESEGGALAANVDIGGGCLGGGHLQGGGGGGGQQGQGGSQKIHLNLKIKGQKKFIVSCLCCVFRNLFYAALVIVVNTCLGCLVSNEVINNREQSRLLYLVSDI